ncbi:unnamed protein product [Dibothriocephalus latus]|uniref:FHA domain-containing protein n=1 Tax=Dibothriocephalus latus TaxID=60516 RepID=A0A3P7LKI4_DIBLA|nr:unnamed protein product [Dibothriocephalus latus]
MDLRGYIVILKKDGAPGPFCDWRADKCVFGSDPSCDVNINLSDIDPVHCTLQALQDGRVMAESHVKPTSRTLLNGEPVVSRTLVPHNSTLTVGERNFKFLYPENSTWISTFRQQSPRSTKKDTGFRSLTTPVVDVDSFPVVRSKSPKPSVPQPFVKRTPTASPARRPLTTRERYGPTPPRPITPAPVVEVKRHESRSSLKPRRSSVGSRNTPISPSLSRKKAKVLIVTNTPGPQSIRRTARQQKTLLSSQQTNNSSITSSYSMLGLKSPNYSSQSAYTAAFLDDPSYDASYDPSTADVLSPAAEYFSSQKKGNFAKFPFTEPRQHTDTQANLEDIGRSKTRENTEITTFPSIDGCSEANEDTEARAHTEDIGRS